MSDTTLAYKTTLDASGFASGAQNLNSHLHQMGINTSAASANLGGLGTLLGTLANPLTLVALGITAIGGALVGSAQAAAAWETSMTGVAKTTGLGDAAFTGSKEALEGLSSGLLEMSTRMPMAADQLASVAAAAGSLGIGQNFADVGDFEGQANAIEGFTEVAIKMGVGFEMSAEQAATAGAKILNSFGVSMDSTNMEKLGSVVNKMGDSFAATEPQVLEFMNRASFLSTTMGQSIPQVAALGTTLISTGLEAEVAATGIKSMLNMLTSTTSKAGGMDNWAKLMGVSVDELKGKVATDLNSTLIETANKIAAIEDPVERFQAAVAAAGTEGAPALLKLAGQQENYTKALGMTNAEWEKASSLQKTFDAQAGTVNSQWQMFMNTLTMATTQLGTGMLPALASALGFMTDLAKVAIKVGETLSDLGAGKVLDAIWKLTPAGMLANSETAQSVWGDIKDWAGIGTEHAEQMAKEIEESDKLQKAGAEGLQAGIDAGVLKDPAKNAAQEFSKEFVDEFEQAQADREIAKILGRSATLTTKETDDALRSFDYLGEQFELKIQSHTGSSIGDWYTYSLKAGDTSLVNSQLGTGNIDPLQAFELATGLPAPEEGTAAYYSLLGDEVAAKKAELQEKLKTITFDYSGITDPLLTELIASGQNIGESASKEMTDAFQNMLDAAKDPSVEKLQEFIESVAENVKLGNVLEADGLDDIRLYKEHLYSGISDMGPYLKDLMSGLGEDSTSAFSDHFFSDEEKESLMGMKPWLEYLKVKSPEEFAKAGGDSWLAFIKAIESGASSSELEKTFGDMGKKAGKSFADALGMNMTNALDKFDWSILTKAKMSLDGISDDGKDFMKNSFQPEAIENWKAQLELWNTGLVENREHVKENMQSYKDMIAIGNDWIFTEDQKLAMSELTAGLIDEGTALTRVIKGTEDLKKETKKFTEETDEACEACVNLLSLFDAWQESTPELFHPSYLGPSYGEEFEVAMVAKAASNRLMQLNNERYAQSSKGIVTTHSEEIQSLEQIMKAYHEGAMTSEEFALANKYLGAEVDITSIQMGELKTAIEGVTYAKTLFDQPVTYEREIQFKTPEEEKTDIRPTLGLNTDQAINDFVAFKAVIEGETIETKLKIDDPTKQNKAKTLDQGSDASRLLAIQMAIQTGITSISQRINATGNSINLSAQTNARGITANASANASGINSTISAAASMIVEAINNIGGGGGGGGGYGSTVDYGTSSGGTGGVAGFVGGYWDGVPGYASGGYVDRPTLAMIGEGTGGEYVVPENDMQQILSMSALSNLSVSASIDVTGMQSQLQAAIDSVSVSPLVIPVAFDSEGMRETLTSMLYEILQEVRV